MSCINCLFFFDGNLWSINRQLQAAMGVVFLYLVMTAALCYGLETNFKFDKVIELNSEKAVKSFVQSSTVRVIYFYKEDLRNLKYFFRDFDEAADSLESYDVTLGFVNCTEESNKDVHLCKLQGSENGIHAFRKGKVIMSFPLAKLFDASSMVANILQLLLLQEVPVLRNEKEVGIFLGNLGGKKDIVFAYLPTIGTADHLSYLEMANELKNELQFAITTDWRATKQLGKLDRTIKEVSTVWWVWAKDETFATVRHRGEFSGCDLAKFVTILMKPKMYDIPGDGEDNPFTEFFVPVVKFYYNAASKEQVYQEATILATYHAGSVWVLLINMDEKVAADQFKYTGKLPAFSGQKSEKSKEKFLKTDLNTPNILHFVSTTLGIKRPPEPADDEEEETTKEEPIVEEYIPRNVEEISSQDDAVAGAVSGSTKIKMPLDLVPALTDTTYVQFIEASQTAVIIYFFPYDAISMANLRMFGEAADMIGEKTSLKIARIDCYDWTDVCQKEKIIIYPTLRVYQMGKSAWDYRGPQDTWAVFSTLKLLEMSLPVYETAKEKVVQYLDGSREINLSAVTNTTVVGLFGKKDKKEKEIFQQLAENSRDRIMYVYTDIKEAGDIAKDYNGKLPAVILSRYDDPVQPYVTFDGKFTLENLQEFVAANKLPKLTVLSPLKFAEVRQKFNELLILFTDGTAGCQQSEDTVKGLAKAQKFNNISYNMIQVPDETSIGYKVLQEYTTHPELPHLSFVKFQKGEVFNFDAGTIDMASVTDWLSNVVKGSVNPSTKLKENEWKPLNKGFEFLKIMDMEQREAGVDNIFTKKIRRTDVPDRSMNAADKDESGGRGDIVPGRVHHHRNKEDKSNKGGDSNQKEQAAVKPEQKSTEKKDDKHVHSEL